jgi:superfamily II DNA or RNA helicase
MAEFELRPYQTDSLDLIRKHYARGTKKVLLHLATGGGKTVIFCEVLKGVQKKGKAAIMVVRGRKLVDQASKRLDREGVDHGVLMAGHKRYKPDLPIQVCSIDTLRARNLRPSADLIVIDEAHFATSDSYKNFLAKYPNAFLLPVTATPYTEKTLSHLAHEVVHPVSVKKLTKDGYLVPPRYFAPAIPDLSGVKTVQTTDGKDFNNKQLTEVMSEGAIIGDIVTEWKDKAKGKPTVCFAVSVKHSQAIADKFNSEGIPAQHIDANHSDREREEAYRRLQNGTIKVITNVGILCTGVDLPYLGCIIMARPTKSYNLYIQQAGRGTRPNPETGKKDFILLDHSGNIARHGFICEEREPSLGEEKVKKTITVSIKICRKCFYAYQGSKCPECGNMETKPRELKSVDGNLKEIKPEDVDPVRIKMEELKAIAKQRGYKRGWVYHRLCDKFGEEIAGRYMPKRQVPSWVLDRLRNTTMS